MCWAARRKGRFSLVCERAVEGEWQSGKVAKGQSGLVLSGVLGREESVLWEDVRALGWGRCARGRVWRGRDGGYCGAFGIRFGSQA